MQEKLNSEEQNILLRLAREAMERGVRCEQLSLLDLDGLPLSLRQEGSPERPALPSGERRRIKGDSDRDLAPYPPRLVGIQ
jgi:hypothetical protein